ncbi:class I SAM-dependent methyltransferase [Aestuariicella hydrocarbonica]|uniref:Class I SAM-dependent methyltransferase n=1 Tax=Pseudomaricurvus hydrocarbonicus TaxID=1470433 RepID=A0A9E5MH02_9GAMM|nr:class I SAM-dependent methyltransferase [Aestuariicella hydrocarbonica]NHO65361.1 class I SAM-dependent methyltransferase [Aestuariicella hydrocarbonica]
MALLDGLSKIKRWAEMRHGPRSSAVTMTSLQGWEKTPLAQAIFTEQKDVMGSLLGELFGYHLLEMSCFDQLQLSDSSRINHKFRITPVAGFDAGALAEFEALPLAPESIDVVILHHVLEYSTKPHQVLREANRVLISRGHLVIVGFNPWSLQGAYKIVAQWVGAGSFWRRRSLRPGRVMDWLHLLDCEPVDLQKGFYRLPINHAGLLEKFSFWEKICSRLKLPFGGFYVLLARKDRVSMIPTKPLWNSFNPVAGLVLGKPTSRVPEAVGQRIECKKVRGKK